MFAIMSSIIVGCGSLKDKQISVDITEKYWKLIELNSKKIEWRDSSNKEPHIILKAENNVIGHGSCNNFQGKYELQEGNHIIFFQVVTTLMACIDMEIENQFFTILSQVDTYSISANGKYFSFIDAKKKSLARFEVVYLR